MPGVTAEKYRDEAQAAGAGRPGQARRVSERGATPTLHKN